MPADDGKLPNGVIDSAELFFGAIRERAGMDPKLTEDAAKILEVEFIETMRSIDARWQDNERRYAMAFYTGMFKGTKISWHRFVRELQVRLAESKNDPQTPN